MSGTDTASCSSLIESNTHMRVGDSVLIVRYTERLEEVPAIGVLSEEGRLSRLPVGSISELLSMPLAHAREAVAHPVEEVTSAPVRLLPPVDGHTEVWASGVTYKRSQEARIEESSVKDVYSRIYEAARPELFLKAVAWRVVGHRDAIGIREDSRLNVPEPELALVLNAQAELLGLTICNDVSSRSIEGENPLYLPQAKIYAGSCALGPGIRPIWEVQDVLGLDIEVEVIREGTHAWKAVTSTSLMHRSLDELVNYLFRADRFPFGAVLSTGTGLVPGMDFTLHSGDEVAITISGIGTLTNVVAEGLAAGVSSPRLASMWPAGPSPA